MTVECASVADVIEAIASARRSGLPLPGLDLSPMRSVSLGVGTVRAGAGTRLGNLYDALATHRLTVPAGCDPATGLAGEVLGGGIGLLGRRYGLTCDRLLSAEVVLADGRVVTCSADVEPDLFWALRGGGAPPGVVTEVVLATVRQPAATAFRLTYRATPDLVEAWQQWAPSAPDEVTANLLLTATDAVVWGVAREAAQLAELIALTGSASTTAFVDGSYRDALRWLEPCTAGAAEFFDGPLPAAIITRLLAEGGELVPLGAAYDRVAPDATAFAHRTDRVLLKAASGVRDEGEGLPRLRAVRKAYDPDGVFSPPSPGTAG